MGAKQAIKLPSEAQWEKAARGTAGWLYPWGNEADPKRANYDSTGIGTTSAVGCFSAGKSPYGVQDMSGNVWEWCATKGQENYDDYKDDNDITADLPRVVRGGSFDNNVGLVRCASRDGGGPIGWSYDMGFRVVSW